MKFKQWIGLVLLSIGVILNIFALHRLGYIPYRTQQVKIVTNSPISPTEQLPTSNGVIIGEPASGYANLVLAAGTVLVLVGLIVAVRYKHS